MALTATIYNFDIELANVDRGVYETLAIRVAQQPSETEEYLLTRVIAYCLEYAEGIAFSRGIAEPDEPPLSVRDLTGALRLWVEFGSPDAARLHKASKASPRVAIYTHKDPLQLLRQIAGERIHRLEDIRALRRRSRAAGLARVETRATNDLAAVAHGGASLSRPGRRVAGWYHCPALARTCRVTLHAPFIFSSRSAQW